MTNKEILIKNLRTIPDWPIKGVNFRDVTTLFKSPECVKIISDEMYDLYKDKGITKIVGIESRGFVMSSAAAIRLGAGIVLCRKPGKLPCETIQESYAKEYGIDTIEIHKDAINENDVVLLHDDLLATGGTMKAACNLVRKFHPKRIYCNFIMELTTVSSYGSSSNPLLSLTAWFLSQIHSVVSGVPTTMASFTSSPRYISTMSPFWNLICSALLPLKVSSG